MHNICTHMLLCSYISYLETRPLIRHGNETRCKAPREPVSPPVNRKGFLLQPRFRKCSTSSSIIFPIYHGITSNYLYKLSHGGTPKSSILNIWFSMTIHFGVPPFMESPTFNTAIAFLPSRHAPWPNPPARRSFGLPPQTWCRTAQTCCRNNQTISAKKHFDPTLFVAVCFNVYLETDMTKTSKSLGMPSWLWHFSMARLARRVI